MKKQSEFTVTMSNSSRNSYFMIAGPSINCISEYSLTGGPETPFEILVLSIPKQRLRYVAPQLIDDIKAGRNEIVVDAIGSGRYTVVKCKYSGRKYRITAYCNAERYKGCTLARSGSDNPLGWVQSILTSSDYGVALSGIVISQDYKYTMTEAEAKAAGTTPEDYAAQFMISFEEGTSIWYILQVCAIMMRCKIWFAENKAFVVDCTRAAAFTRTPEAVDLYTDDTSAPLYARTVNEVTLGSEGTDTLVNSITLRCTKPGSDYLGTEDTTISLGPIRDTASVKKYGESKVGPLSIPELKEGEVQLDPESRKDTETEGETQEEEGSEEEEYKIVYSQGTTFIENYMAYYLEPQQSVSFELKEMEQDENEYGWQPFWTNPAACSSIKADVDDIYITNSSEFEGSKPHLLMMSTYERHYPTGTTEYTFGQMKSIDLSSSTSQILTAIYK